MSPKEILPRSVSECQGFLPISGALVVMTRLFSSLCISFSHLYNFHCEYSFELHKLATSPKHSRSSLTLSNFVLPLPHAIDSVGLLVPVRRLLGSEKLGNDTLHLTSPHPRICTCYFSLYLHNLLETIQLLAATPELLFSLRVECSILSPALPSLCKTWLIKPSTTLSITVAWSN